VRKEALSADDLANLLGVTIRTLRNWERDGSGPTREIRDLEPFYPLETLVPWLKKHRPDVELGDRARTIDGAARLRLLEAWERLLCQRYRLESAEELYAALRHADFHQRGYSGGPDKLESWHVASYAAFSGVLLIHDLSGEQLKSLLADFESRADLGLARRNNLSGAEFAEQIQAALDEEIAKEIVDRQPLRQSRDHVAIGHRYACQITGKYAPPPGNPNIMASALFEQNREAQS
jgi:transcriptional regulator with XRE-family HTH domain